MSNGSDKTVHLDCIDGVKGLAACVIAFFLHYQHFSMPPQVPFFNVFRVSYENGFFMVELFFMLSGFGMSIGYVNKILNRQISFGVYMGKRIRKLYPLFLLSTFIVAVLEFIIHSSSGELFVYQNYDLYHLILNLLLLQNGVLETAWSFNSPSWVISVLVVMYVLLYLVCYYSKSISRVVAVFAVLAIVGCVIILSEINAPIVNELMGRGLACFSIGVIMYGIYRNIDLFNAKLLSYCFLFFLAFSYYLFRIQKMEYIGNARMFIILGAAPMIIICILSIKWLNSFLSLKPFVLLGKISFSIYLLHFPIQCCFKFIDTNIISLDFSSWKIWLLYIISTITISVIYSFVISEKYESCLHRIIIKNNSLS